MRRDVQRTGSLRSVAGSTIQERQNAPWSIDLLAAQRQLYTEAKTWRAWRTRSVVAISLLGLLCTIVFPSALVLVGPIGAVFAVVQFCASLAEKQRTKNAANIQEQFDTAVFPLEWNPLLVGQRVDPEDVAAASRRQRGPREKLRNWYAVPDGLPYALQVLLCQRSNLRWDARLRQAYAFQVTVTMVALGVAIVALATVRVLSVGDFVLSVMPSVGAFVLGVETVRSHRQHCTEQLDLKAKVEAAWRDGLRNPRSVRTAPLRAVQDGIYRLRVAAPPVPDRFYWSKREQFEQEMKAAAERMQQEVDEARPRLCGS